MTTKNIHDWLLDTGAPMHTCSFRSAFFTYAKAPEGLQCYTANKSYSTVEGKGQVMLKFTSGKILTLEDVWHIPDFTKNLVSGSKLCDKGFMIDVTSEYFVLTENKIPVGYGYRYGGHYKLCAVVEGQGLAFSQPTVSSALPSVPADNKQIDMTTKNIHDWLLDTGAPMHTCSFRNAFLTYTKAPQGLRCYTANKSYSTVEGKGQVMLKFTSGKILTLEDVWHVPEFTKNLVSGSKLCNKGFMINVTSEYFVLTENKIHVGYGYRCGGHYKLCAVVEVNCPVMDKGQGLAFAQPTVSSALPSVPSHNLRGSNEIKRKVDNTSGQLPQTHDYSIKKQNLGNGWGQLPQQQSTGSMKNMTEKGSTVTDKELSIKLLIDSKANKVLFAVAEKEFIDFLLGLLAMPLGTVIELITEENMMGSMGNLYKSVKNISDTHILCKNSKLLKPEVVLICAGRQSYYSASSGYNYVMKLLGRKCASSNNQIAGRVSNGDGNFNLGHGYVKGGKYLVTDGLSVMPVSTTSRINLLEMFNVGDVTSLKKKTVSFGIKEGLEVLWAALQSTTVLSEVFLEKIINPEMHKELPSQWTKENTNMVTEKKLTIKLVVNSKANRVIVAVVNKEFIDFLFSFLALPLGSITELIAKENMVGSIGNLYESVESISSAYIQCDIDKNSLLKPKIIISAEKIKHNYLCLVSSGHNLVTKLLESSSPSCCNKKNNLGAGFIATDVYRASKVDGFVQGGSVRYFVTDELVVVPMTTSSRISVFEKYNVVDFSALKVKTVNFGIKEGLEVLKTALQSKTVLTDSNQDAVQRPGKPEIIVLD